MHATTQAIRNSASLPSLQRGLLRKQPRERSEPRAQVMWIIRGLLLIALTLGCLALLPSARAVDPPPDGGYANQNTAEGEDALLSLSTGTDNTALGFDALFSNTEGSDNTATGSGALQSNTTGTENTANGSG